MPKPISKPPVVNGKPSASERIVMQLSSDLWQLEHTQANGVAAQEDLADEVGALTKAVEGLQSAIEELIETMKSSKKGQ